MRCPSSSQLEQFLNGQLAGAAGESVAGHVDCCTACQHVLEALTGDNEQIGNRFREPQDEALSITLTRLVQMGGPFGDLFDTLAPVDGSLPIPISLPEVEGYEVLGLLGRGGQATVFKARDQRLKRIVALKMLRTADVADKRMLERFRREAETLARLHHPNIVQIYEVGEQDGTPYFAMEFVPGGNLHARINGTPQPNRPAAELLEKLARAVHAAHRVGIIHRDLKPANILLSSRMPRMPKMEQNDENGREGPAFASSISLHGVLPVQSVPKITDFGLAKALETETVTTTGMVMGTPGYMAPEQASGDRIGPGTDIHALGAILYHALTGRPPYLATDPLEVMLQVIHAEPVSIRRVLPSVPKDLETICLKCLQKSPGKRYATADELADDLRRFLDGKPILARPVHVVERAWRWIRRNPTGAIQALAATSIAVVGLILVAVLWWRGEGERATAVRSADLAAQATEEAQEKRVLAELAQLSAEEAQANLALNQGLTLCEQGEIRSGLLWFSHSLELAERANATYLVRAIRINLADWSNELPTYGPTFRHRGGVANIAISADGKSLVSAGSGDGQARFWDLATGKEIGPSLDHPRAAILAGKYLRHASWSPDASFIATANGDGKARIWNAATHRLAFPPMDMGNSTEVWQTAFTPDGARMIAIASDGVVRTFDAHSGENVGPEIQHGGSTGGFYTLTLSADGSRLATAGADRTVRFWNPLTGDPLPGSLSFHSLPEILRFTPDGRRLMIGTRDGSIHAWDVTLSLRTDLPPQGDAVVALAFTADGRFFATGTRGGIVRVWDGQTLAPLWLLHRDDHEINGLSFHPDGRTLAIGTSDGSIRMCKIPVPRSLGAALIPFPDLMDEVHSVAFDARGQILLTGGFQGVRLWDPATGRLLNPAKFASRGQTTAAAISPDGATVALGGFRGAMSLLNAKSAEVTFRPPSLMVRTVGPIPFSPDGRWLLTVSARDTDVPLRLSGSWIWDLSGEKPQPRAVFKKLDPIVMAAAFHPDSQTLLLGCQDGTARFWDLARDQQIGPILNHGSAVTATTWSRNGRRAITGGRDGTVRLWDANSGEPLLEAFRHRAEVTAVAFSPEGDLVMTGSLDGTARFWDPSCGRPLGPPRLHGGGIRSAVFHPYGTMIATGSKDGSAQRWRIPAGPMAGNAAEIREKIEGMTGLTLDAKGNIRLRSSEKAASP